MVALRKQRGEPGHMTIGKGNTHKWIIDELAISDIQPAPYNPRKDLKPGDAEYEKLRHVMDRYDLVEPLVWNKRTRHLVGGHQRLKILKARGDVTVPAVIVDLDEADEKALNLA